MVDECTDGCRIREVGNGGAGGSVCRADASSSMGGYSPGLMAVGGCGGDIGGDCVFGAGGSEAAGNRLVVFGDPTAGGGGGKGVAEVEVGSGSIYDTVGELARRVCDGSGGFGDSVGSEILGEEEGNNSRCGSVDTGGGRDVD